MRQSLELGKIGEIVMPTKFVLQREDGLFYQGLGWTRVALDARKFDTRAEAEKRLLLRPEWKVIEIDVSYRSENLRRSAVLFLLALLFASNISAQTFTQSFQTSAVTSQGGTAQIASGDLRGKGYADIVVTSPQICVLFNNGDGTFQNPSCFGNIPGIAGIAVADFNKDGHLDIAVAGQDINQGYFAVFYGDGTGAFSGSTGSALMSAGGGVLSGPVAGSLEGNTNIQAVIAGGNCTNGSINNGTQPLNSTVIEAELNGMNTNVYPTISMTGCGGVVFGVVNGFAVGNGFLYNSTGLTPYTLCAGKTVAVGTYAVSFDSSGNVCIQQPPSASVAGMGTFVLTGDQRVASLFSVILGNNQTGLAAIVSSPTVTTPVGLLYGGDLLHLTQTGSITANLTLPTAGVANTFRANGTTAQDIAVLDQNGLTVFTQGTFSGAFSSSSLTFPAQALGTSSTQQIKFTNTGTGALTPLAISVTGSSDFTQTNDCPTILAAGAFCTVTVQFLPGTVEVSSIGTLTATSKLVTQSVALTGSEILSVNPVLSQSSLTFGNQLDGTTSTAQTVQLSNQGNESVNTTVSVSANFGQTNNCASLTAGASCNVSVTFDPTTPGPLTGAVTLQFSTGNPQQQIALTGTGVVAPSITTQPASQTVVSGNPVTFTVAATGTAPLIYTWKKNNVVVGTNSATLTFTTVPTDNSVTITATVTNAYGVATSSTATLTVLTVPIIQMQPASTAVTLGQAATFSVVATGTAPLSYAWSKGGVAVGSNSSTYTTTATVSGDNGTVVNVTVSNSAGHVTSSNAILTVDFPSIITQQPTNQTVLSGQTATFSVQATGTGLTYQWQRSNAAISGATNSTYTFQTTAADNGALFNVVVSDPYGPSVASNTVTLTVNTPPSITSQTPTGGNTVLVGVGGTTTMSATVTGTAPLTFQWQHQGVAISGANSSTYTTPALTAADDRTSYTLTVTNPYGTVTSLPWSVAVILPPVVTAQSPNPSVQVGQSASFSVNYITNGGAPVSFAWTHNGVAVADTTASFIIQSVQTTDAGSVQLVLTDLGGSTTVTWNLSVTNAPVPLALVFASPTQTVTAGSSASYQVQVTQNINGTTALSCSTSVPSGTCTVSPTSVTSSTRVNLTVTTPTTATVPITPIRIINWPWLLLVLTGAMAFVTRPRYSKQLKLTLASASLMLLIGGCGGSSASTQPPPPPPPTSHSYTVTVVGNLPGASQQQATATLVVTAAQ